MTYAGEYAINNKTSVNIPDVYSLRDMSKVFRNTSSTNDTPKSYIDDEYIYIFSARDTYGIYIFRAPITDPANFEQVGQFGNGYNLEYSFLVKNSTHLYIIGGIASMSIYKASINDPLSWIKLDPTQNLTHPIGMPVVYTNGNDVYVYGGYDNNSTQVLNTIYKITLSNPISITSVGPMPVNRCGATLYTVGSNIYILGGYVGNLTNYTTSILTASISVPQTVTEVGDTSISLALMTSYVDSNYIYFFGGKGVENGDPITDIYRTLISNPAPTNLGSKIGDLSLATSNTVLYDIGNYLYLADGSTTSSSYNTQQIALKSDPTLWNFSTNESNRPSVSVLPANCDTYFGNVFKINDIIYSIGGYTGLTNSDSAHNKITISDSKSMGTWKHVAQFPIPIAGNRIIRIGDYLYSIGGINTDASALVTTIYKAPVSNPLNWSAHSTGFPGAYRGDVAIIGNNLYYIGGTKQLSNNFQYYIPGGAHKKIYKIPLNADFDSNSWVEYGELANSRMDFSLVVASNIPYLIKGVDPSGTPYNNIDYYFSVFSNPLSSMFTTPSYGSSVFISNNKIYILGGVNSSNNFTYECLIFNFNNFINYNPTGVNDVGENNEVSDIARIISSDFESFGGKSIIGYDGNIYLISGTKISRTHLPQEYDIVGAYDQTNSNLIINKAGNIGSYGIFEKTGFLPWHIKI